MPSATDAAEQAIAKMDHEENVTPPPPAGNPAPAPTQTPPADAPKDKPADKKDDDGAGTGDKDKKDDTPPAPKYDKDGKRIEEPAVDKDKKDDKADDGTFTADDALEVDDDTPPAPKEVTPTDAAGVQLSSAEQKYIKDHIGDIGNPVEFTGTIGGKAVSYKVYDISQLPQTFEPDNQVAFQQGLRTLDNMAKRAEQLLGQFRQEQSQASTQDFERRENEAIRMDVADLQKSGDFPKFKVQPGQPGFDDDPAAKQMAEVIGVMNERNDMYLKQYQQGRAYRHIGFAEAHDIWRAKKGNGTPPPKASDAQDQEDAERKNSADRIGTNRGLTAQGVVKPTVRPGTTIEQILARHENEF